MISVFKTVASSMLNFVLPIPVGPAIYIRVLSDMI